MLFEKKQGILPLPKLHSPTIDLLGTIVTVNNPAENGNFADFWELYMSGNDVPVAVKPLEENNFDIESLPSSVIGTSVYAKVKGKSFLDSDSSNTERYVVYQPLSVGRSNLAGANTQNFAIFAGGSRNGTAQTAAEAYNKDFVRFIPNALSVAREKISAVSLDDYAVFAGGYGAGSYHDVVEVYSNDLTLVSVAALTEGRSECAAAKGLSSFAVFGGKKSNGNSCYIDLYDNELTKISGAEFTSAHANGSASNDGAYYVHLVGGSDTDAIDIFDNDAFSFVWSETLFAAREGHKVVEFGDINYSLAGVIIGAGKGASGVVTDVEYMDTYFIHGSLNCTYGGYDYAAACLANSAEGYKMALFAGGYDGANALKTATIYDGTIMTMTSMPDFSIGRYSHACATVGGTLLFAGGKPNELASIEVYNSEYEHSLIN